MTFSRNIRLSARDILDGLARHGVRQEANKIAGMPGLERNADFAVSLEPTNARAVPGARVEHNERPQLRIEFDTLRRNDPHKNIVDGPVERAAVNDEFDFVVQNVWGGLG